MIFVHLAISKFRKDFQGITVGNNFILMKQSDLEDGSQHNFNSIYQAASNQFTEFKTGRSDRILLDAYKSASGSCFVTLSTKHFLQIGGTDEDGNVGTTVKLFSYDNRNLFEIGHSRGRGGRIINQGHQVWYQKLINQSLYFYLLFRLLS